MQRSLFARILPCITIGLLAVTILPCAFAQYTQGRISVTVLDPQQAVVPGADLELVDLATNATRTGVTQSAGTFSFVNLPPGKYKLTISREGFQKAVYEVVVEGTKSTDIQANLKLGTPTQIISVEETATPVVEETQDAIGAVIDLKHIQDLPLQGRDISSMARIVPGYTGTWDGLPSIAQGNNVDGVIGSSSRMKFSGNSTPSVQVRLENIEEMTVQTDQLDENQGFGMAAMQSNFTTRRGTSAYHGQFFEDLRNDDLNANSWRNNAVGVPRGEFKLNEFGGSFGGPVPKFKDKLFFFASVSTARQPGFGSWNSNFLSPSAQQGNFTYVGTDGQNHTVNVLNAAQGFNSGLPSTINSVVAGQFQRINTAVQSGSVVPTTDPIVNSVNWLSPNPTTRWFETFRLDYNITSKWSVDLALNRTKVDSPNANAPYFPGTDFAAAAGGNQSDNFTSSLGIDWMASPTLINSFKFGYLYPWAGNPYGTSPEFFGYVNNPERVGWPTIGGIGLTTPMDYYVPISTFYPVFNVSDAVTWQKGAHQLNFGFSWYREQDHYWNPPELTNVTLGLVQGDPALDALTNAGGYQPLPFASAAQQADAQNLYALLTGRISNLEGSFPYDPKTGNYIQQRARYFTLNEVAKAGGLFVQDSWRLRPGLTINGGLRWDLTTASLDKQGAYHNADVSSLWGPSGVGNLFKPGVLTGNMNPTIEARPQPYNNWYVAPQPSLGIAWAPGRHSGFLQKLLGSDDTVIRTSFSLRRFTVPYQYFWNNASDYGSFFYQFYQTTARNVPGPGSFAPGSVSLGQQYPQYLLQPDKYQSVVPEAAFTFNNGQFTNGSNGMKFDIQQPYTMTWTFGVQRKLGQSRALEIRYNGNRTLKQWISQNLNEVNIFENGFLQEFMNAQKNLAINGGKSFANLNPAAGTVPVPILTAAFTGSKDGSQTDRNFSSGTFITQLNTGAAGSMANSLTRLGSAPFFCNLVGASFTPCATNAGYTGAGAGYPINFFQANPYASGIPSLMMTDAGWSTYNSMQVDFRQRYWHGLAFDANYTWSHTLGVSTPNDWTGAYYAYTLRNMDMSYGPTLFDARHVVNFSGTVDLPFGIGRKWAIQNRAVDKVIGGWTVGTITTFRTGYPFRLLGGYNTFNNIGDGGVLLNGITRDQLQNAVGVYKTGGPFVQLIDPRFRTSGVGANTAFVTANTNPGTFAPLTWLYGPHGFYSDVSLTKETAITERVKFTFQAELLNAFNHPVFGTSMGSPPVTVNVRSSSWATATGASNGPRAIEFRANVSF